MMMPGPMTLCVLVFAMVAYGTGESIFHGGTFLAFAGKDSVMIASDSRFSGGSNMMIGQFNRKVFRVGHNTLVGCLGLEGDIFTLMGILRRKIEMLANDVEIGPMQVSRLISDSLHSSGMYIVPLVVGISSDGAYICSMDSLGAQTESNSFDVIGTGEEALFAICESMYSPGLQAEELVALAKKCLRLAFQRDILSGCKLRVLTIQNGDIFSADVESDDV